MQIVPIQADPNQTLTVLLAGQACRINIYQKRTGLFLELFVNDEPIIGATLCNNQVRLVRDAYLGFLGDLAFTDTQGSAAPDYTGLGTRFLLIYLEVADLS